MPYRLAIPQYERQGMSETYLSPKGVKSMRKQLNDKTRLAESNRCCAAMTPSAVEHMARLSVQFGECPIRRLHGKPKMEDRL